MAEKWTPVTKEGKNSSENFFFLSEKVYLHYFRIFYTLKMEFFSHLKYTRTDCNFPKLS
jgi:hypothetical protein